jgi:L-iditol 2-dehydrogenase
MSSVPEKMFCAVYYSNTDVRLEERPVPKIGYGELLVKTEACGLCGGETMEWYLAPRAPWVLGHEPAGVVVQVGEGVTKFKEGDRVFVHHHVSCMSCHFCNRGYYSMCNQYSKTKLYPGGFSEYFRVAAPNVQFDTQILPDNVTFEQGTLLEPMGCTLSGIKACNIRYGDTVAIIGLGFMGMSYLEQAKISPAGKIIGLDFSDWRLEKAKTLGATHTINSKKIDAVSAIKELNNGRLADVVIVTAPFVSAWDAGLHLCEKTATLHLGAPVDPEATWTIQANPLYFREIKIVPTYSSSQVESLEVLDLISSGRLDVNPLITHHFGLDKVQDAIQLMLKANNSLKPMIVPSMTMFK